MNTILHKISRLFLPVLLLLTIASCSYPSYNRYNSGPYYHQRQYDYGHSRPGWHDRDHDRYWDRNRGQDRW